MSRLKFNRMELAGSLADLGTMLPLLIPLVIINGVNATIALLMVGLFYIGAGLYYQIPIPVQPLKAVAAIAIAGGFSANVIAASGLIMGLFMFLMASTGLINQVARVFTKPVIRGIQVALGLLLFTKGAQYIVGSNLFVSGQIAPVYGIPLNIIIGVAGIMVAALLITNKKIPAAIVLVGFGVLIGLAFKLPTISLGPQIPSPRLPSIMDFQTALVLLVLPQIPVTLSNSVIATSDLAKKYFRNGRASHRALSSSVCVANFASGAFGGIPMCHGAGGLAAHYRFGARTGGANLIIGGIFVAMALIFGSSAMSILGLIPLSILGVLLASSGIQMMLLANDVKKELDLLVVFTIVGLNVATDMTIAFITGIILYYVLRVWSSWSKKSK